MSSYVNIRMKEIFFLFSTNQESATKKERKYK